MTAIHRIRVLPRRLGAMLVITAVVLSFTGSARAQEDDNEAKEVAPAMRFEIMPEQFDSWVFESMPSAKVAQERLDKLLGLHIADVQRTCKLSDVQLKKLDLAGRGDVKRFFEKVEVVRKKFLLVRKDQNKFNEIWQDIQPLQLAFQGGLFHEGSMFHKTLKSTLDPDQLGRYMELERERKQFHYRAKVELMVSILEDGLPLRDEQREKLISLLIENSRPPRSYGQLDYYVVLWNLSKIPQDKLKPLFDGAEWRVLSAQFAQAQGMEQMLKQNGVLPSDDENAGAR